MYVFTLVPHHITQCTNYIEPQIFALLFVELIKMGNIIAQCQAAYCDSLRHSCDLGT